MVSLGHNELNSSDRVGPIEGERYGIFAASVTGEIQAYSLKIEVFIGCYLPPIMDDCLSEWLLNSVLLHSKNVLRNV